MTVLYLDVAALSAKELLAEGVALPQISFTCKYLPVKVPTNGELPLPRYVEGGKVMEH